MSIYNRIRDLCYDTGETITGLEKTLGFARGSLSKIDKSSPSAERVKKIADHFGVTTTWIMTGESPEVEYYTNAETTREAQRVFDDPNLRLLFDAAKDSKPENIRLAAEILQRFKESNPNG